MSKDFLEVITDPPTVEQEFAVEQKIREILDCNDLNELKAIASVLMKQNSYQGHVLTSAITKISKLENKVQQLQSRITKLMKLKHPCLSTLQFLLKKNS
tara:strand:+ start:119 stop:415 length:297 start_codon:yes stop_codon:yes gene_type:complete